jgi:transcriptional regulator with XRE-family HTH domain
MARTKNTSEVREAFALRLKEELDRVGYPAQGRASGMARDLGVSHTTTGSWLRGAMPAVGVLVDVCQRYGLDFTYLCTGERSTANDAPAVDADLFRSAADAVNQAIRENGWLDDIGLDRLGTLYMRAYISLRDAGSQEQVMEDVRLAAGK